MRDALVYSLPEATNAEGVLVPTSTGPFTLVPGGGGWHTLFRQLPSPRNPDVPFLHVLRFNSSPTAGEGLYAVFGEPDELARLPGSGRSFRAAWNGGDPQGSDVALLRRWPYWRCSGQRRGIDIEGNPVAVPFTGQAVQLLRSDGQLVPNLASLPWLVREDGTITTVQSEAEFRVTAITRPALTRTVAGFDLPAAVEREE